MKKLSNKWLIISLLALVGIFAASRFFRAPGQESNLRQQLVKIDTATVSELRVKPSTGGEELKLTRTGSNWQIEQGAKKANADAAIVKSAISSLAVLKPMRMVSRKKDKWNDFQVGEAGLMVTIYNDGNKTADLHIGKTNFTQTAQGGFGGGYTYVRLSDENEVYAVDGFLESSFNRAYADWRNKNFLRVNREAIAKIIFTYPADSSFVVEKRDTVWMVNGAPANLNNVNTYLGQLSYKNLNAFADDFQPVGTAPAVIKIEATGGPLETIEAWPLGEGKWAFRSTLQPVIFTSDGSSIVSDLLKGKKYFLP